MFLASNIDEGLSLRAFLITEHNDGDHNGLFKTTESTTSDSDRTDLRSIEITLHGLFTFHSGFLLIFQNLEANYTPLWAALCCSG